MKKFKTIFFPHWVGLAPAVTTPSPQTSAKKIKESAYELQDFDEIEIPLSRNNAESSCELKLNKFSQSEHVNSQPSVGQTPDKSSSSKNQKYVRQNSSDYSKKGSKINDECASQVGCQLESQVNKVKSVKSQKNQNSQQIHLNAEQTAIANLARQLQPLTNQRIVLSKAQAASQANLLVCNNEECQFNHVMKEGLQMGEDFEVLSKGQWKLLVRYFSDRTEISGPRPLIRSHERIGLGIRTQIEYFYEKVRKKEGLHQTFSQSSAYSLYFQFSILFISAYPEMLDFHQRHQPENPEDQDHEKGSHFNGNFNIHFSSKRSIDKLKSRIISILQDQLDIVKISQSRVRLWFSEEEHVNELKRDIREMEAKGKGKTRQLQDLQRSLVLQNGHFIDLHSQNLVEQIFFENEKKFLVVEVTQKNSEVFMLRQRPLSERDSQENKLVILAKCSYCQQMNRLYYNCHCYKVNYCSKECQANDLKFHEEKCQGLDAIEQWDQSCQPNQDARLGLTGIRNLNNSCYLSSSIQCLSHSIGLSNYFLQGLFKEEINYQNPLGTQGKLAIGFAKLMKQLWFDGKDSVAPFQLKSVIAKFKKQFNNQDQQDSQELLNVLLDGLHEDLNRVKNKPLVPVLESEGNNDVEASCESWKNHLKRNQSVIVDLMHGLYKSTVRCPDCNCVSVTFEPYMNISLPIPEIKLIQKQFFWVPFDPSKRCVLFNFSIKSHKQINNLKEFIGNSFNVNKHSFDIVLIQDDAVRRILPKYELLSVLSNNSLSASTIVAFETDPRALKKSYRQSSNINSRNYSRDDSQYPGAVPTKRPTSHPQINLLRSFQEVPMINSHQDHQPFLSQPAPQSPRMIQTAQASKLKQKAQETNNGFHRKLKPQKMQVITNLQIVHDIDKQEKLEQEDSTERIFGDKGRCEDIYEMVFPRLSFLNLDGSLIDAHLDIFRQLSPLFQKYLETRERVNTDPRDLKALTKRRKVQIPPLMTSEKWKKMSLNEQYEAVFGPNDPSRRKLRDLPYLVRIVSRKRMMQINSPCNGKQSQNGANSNQSANLPCNNTSKQQPSKTNTENIQQQICCCIYCGRQQCKGCPLRFDDKITLRQVLTKAGVTTSPSYFYEENRQSQLIQSTKKNNKTPLKTKKTKKSKQKQTKVINTAIVDEDQQSDNFEFELLVQFNPRKCWALYSCFNRFIHYENSEHKIHDIPNSNDKVAEGVSIYDCFRQFNRPEKLSQTNAWYCNRCVDHKQAVKKIQVYNVPPVLIINLKRFRGNQSKQNTLVNFPKDGLDMSEFVVSRDQPPHRPIYDLFAVSNHTGQLSAGHYTAMALNRGKWYQFNDHKVLECSEKDQIVSSAAYILFYARRGINFEHLDYNRIRNKLDNESALNSPNSTKRDQESAKKEQTNSQQSNQQIRQINDEEEQAVPILLETGGT